jgi:hypothetical protein
MTYGEFKELGFPDIMPMENVLAQVLFDRKIDVSEVLNAYYHALEAERHKLFSQFEEACICLNMHLSKNWKGENKKKLEKRMIHIFNKSKTLPSHIWDKMYNYTEEDEKEQEEDYVMHFYGALNRFGL